MVLAAQPISNQSEPPGCKGKVLQYTSPLSAVTTDELDLRQFILRGYINAIQGVFIDNSANGSSVTLTCQGTGQTVSCPPGYQGWFPLLVIPGTEVFTIASSGSSDVPFFFVNIPMPAVVYSAT